MKKTLKYILIGAFMGQTALGVYWVSENLHKNIDNLNFFSALWGISCLIIGISVVVVCVLRVWDWLNEEK